MNDNITATEIGENAARSLFFSVGVDEAAEAFVSFRSAYINLCVSGCNDGNEELEKQLERINNIK